jgi:hypothetical protein
MAAKVNQMVGTDQITGTEQHRPQGKAAIAILVSAGQFHDTDCYSRI